MTFAERTSPPRIARFNTRLTFSNLEDVYSKSATIAVIMDGTLIATSLPMRGERTPSY